MDGRRIGEEQMKVSEQVRMPPCWGAARFANALGGAAGLTAGAVAGIATVFAVHVGGASAAVTGGVYLGTGVATWLAVRAFHGRALRRLREVGRNEARRFSREHFPGVEEARDAEDASVSGQELGEMLRKAAESTGQSQKAFRQACSWLIWVCVPLLWLKPAALAGVGPLTASGVLGLFWASFGWAVFRFFHLRAEARGEGAMRAVHLRLLKAIVRTRTHHKALGDGLREAILSALAESAVNTPNTTLFGRTPDDDQPN